MQNSPFCLPLNSLFRLSWQLSGKEFILPMPETGFRSLGREDLLEEEMATYFSVLAWEIPWTEEPGGLQSMGLQRVGDHWDTKWQQILHSSPDLLPHATTTHPKEQKQSREFISQLKIFTSYSWIWIKPLHKSHQFPPAPPIHLRVLIKIAKSHHLLGLS